MWKFLSNLIALNSALAQKARAITAYDEALAYYEAKDYKRAFPLILEAANLGNIEAMVLLGSDFIIGERLLENGKEAERWLRAAAETGHDGAKSLLGMGYVTGKGGFPIDVELGTKLLEAAAEAGDEKSAEMLQMMRDKKGIFSKKRR